MRPHLEAVKGGMLALGDAILACEPRPLLRVGVIDYRDKGDAWRIKRFDFTSDVATWREDVEMLEAGGGGDWPEGVAFALRIAMDHLAWDLDPRARRALFLFGDAPNLITDDPDYERAVARATRNGIPFHTVALSADAEMLEQWKRLAGGTGGTFWPFLPALPRTRR